MSRAELPIDKNPAHLLRLLAHIANQASDLIDLRIDDKPAGCFYDDCAEALEADDQRLFLQKWRHAKGLLLHLEHVVRELGDRTEQLRALQAQLDLAELLGLPPSPTQQDPTS